MWISSGRVSDPITNQVLLDTGALPLGNGVLSFMFIGASTVASVFEIQLRDATNITTLKSQIVAVPASGTVAIPETPINPPFTIATNERLRIIQVVGITGQVSVSLFYT